jgi:protocatechuate 3,4-dioxygenase beta subunit
MSSCTKRLIKSDGRRGGAFPACWQAHRAVRQTVRFVLPVLLLAVASSGGATGEEAAARRREDFPWPFRLQLQKDAPVVVEGRVLNPDGRPIEGADVAVVAILQSLYIRPNLPPQVLGTAKSGENGEFRMSVATPPPYQCAALKLVARHGVWGVGAKTLDLLAQRQDGTVRLRTGRVVRGRVLDPSGSPVAGAPVHLVGVSDDTNGIYFQSSVTAPAAWPAAAKTDGEGRFEVANVPADMTSVPLEIPDERLAPGVFALQVPKAEAEEGIVRLPESRLVEGTVVRGDSGEPLANAWLLVVLGGGSSTGDLQAEGVPARADAKGRFRALCRAGEYLTVYVYPPFGEPYPSWVEKSAPWPKDAVRREVRVSVPRGVLLKGKVVDSNSGAGIADTGVEYMIRWDKNPYFNDDVCHQLYWGAEYRRALTREDGSFELAVVPGAGSLLVRAPTPDFVGRLVSWGELQRREKGGQFVYVDGWLPIDPKPEEKTLAVKIPLRRGVTVRGRVVGPTGQNVRSALALYSYYGLSFYPLYHLAEMAQRAGVRDGRYELRGCDPKVVAKVYFLDLEQGWGASADIDPREGAKEPPAVRLAPCGSATVRIVDAQKVPRANLAVCSNRPPFLFPKLVTDIHLPLKGDKHLASPHLGLDPRGLEGRPYAKLRTDMDGRVTFPLLVPGAPYRLQLEGAPLGTAHDKQDFTVRAGEELKLEDVTIDRPMRRPR